MKLHALVLLFLFSVAVVVVVVHSSSAPYPCILDDHERHFNNILEYIGVPVDSDDDLDWNLDVFEGDEEEDQGYLDIPSSDGADGSFPLSLADISVQAVYRKLLQKYRQTDPSLAKEKSISWHKVVVSEGWPEKVTFYVPKSWSRRSHLYAVFEAIDRIKFELAQETSKVYSKQERMEIKAEVTSLSRKIYGGDLINWRAIKRDVRDLHLTAPSFSNLNNQDFRIIEEKVLVVLQRKARELDERVAQVCTNECDQQQEPNEAGLLSRPLHRMSRTAMQDFTYNQLLARYRESIGSGAAKLINWSQLEVLGWPENVIFFAKSHWTKSECHEILESLPSINFVHIDYSANRPVSSAYKGHKRDLYIDLKVQVRRHFPKEEQSLIWVLLKRIFRRLHLSQSKAMYWNENEVRMLERILMHLQSTPPGCLVPIDGALLPAPLPPVLGEKRRYEASEQDHLSMMETRRQRTL